MGFFEFLSVLVMSAFGIALVAVLVFIILGVFALVGIWFVLSWVMLLFKRSTTSSKQVKKQTDSAMRYVLLMAVTAVFLFATVAVGSSFAWIFGGLMVAMIALLSDKLSGISDLEDPIEQAE